MRPPGSFEIQCDSINYWTHSAHPTPPLAADEKWSIHIEPLQHSDLYQLSMQHSKNNQQVGAPFIGKAELNYAKLEGPVVSLRFTLPGAKPGLPNGVFTFNHMPLKGLNSFIMYGWSTTPMTASAAMEYRCELLDWDQVGGNF